MTTPNVTFVNPVKEYVLAPTVTGAQEALKITEPPGMGTYAPLSRGMSEVQVTWDGDSSMIVYYSPRSMWSDRRLVGRIPAGNFGETRRLSFSVASDNDTHGVVLLTTATMETLNYRAGVRVINNTELSKNL